MKVAFLLPLPFLLVLLELINATEDSIDIHLTGNLTCADSFSRSWCARMILMEDETEGTPFYDEVDEVLVKCTDKRSMEYEMQGKQKIYGLLDPFYELHMLIYHTCSDDDTAWKQDEILDPVPVFDTNIKRTEDFVLTKAIQVESLSGHH